MMMTIAYLRCSSTEQTIAHQEMSILNYAQRNNLTIERIIKDEGISAYRKDVSFRDGFLEVLDLAKKGEVENLIVFESSRISRQFIESQTIIDELTRCNVKIHSVSDNNIINQNELDQLFIAFRSFMNQKASKETSLRVKSAHQLLREQGKHAAGALPYGHLLVDGYCVVNEELVPEIINMFEDYCNYSSKYVQEKYGIRNRKTLIERISHPAMRDIVGEGLFVRANKVKQSRKCVAKSSANNLNRTDILFEGLLFHKVCGCKLYVNKDYRSKNHVHSYRCVHCRGNETVTTKKSFSGTKLDKFLESEILKVLDNLNHDSLYEKYNNRCTKKKLALELQLKNLSKELGEVNSTITKASTKLTNLILNDADDSVIGVITELISNKKNQGTQLQQQITEKETEIASLLESEVANESIIANILNAKNIFKNATIPQKKAILQMLIRRIEVSDVGEADIFLNI
jgi:DNA invertase Pin-like site-specific DNA recombinase